MHRLPKNFNPNHRVVPEDSPLYDNPNDLKFQGPELSWFWIPATIAAGWYANKKKKENEQRVKREVEAANREAQAATEEYNRVAGRITSEQQAREKQAAALKSYQTKEIEKAQAGSAAARAELGRVTEEGTRAVAYATKQTAATKSKIEQQKASKLAEQSKLQKVKQTSPKAPGIATTIVRGPSDVGGVGKPGSATGKTKGVRDKAGKLVIG
tara:strand:- start:3226 stop:3861 length:636 start_codon:yes stop_codon:yes gene_type:complete